MIKKSEFVYRYPIILYNRHIPVWFQTRAERLSWHFSKEDLPYVFDRFYKSDKSRSRDRTGAGLGLYISKTIMEAHGEELTRVSEEGRSCSFTFTLPFAGE